jgi:lipopolysaccharide transport system ATP-binding protein
MTKPIIEIENLGKRYLIGAHKERYLSLRHEIARLFSVSARHARAAEREFWALRNISFNIQEGEVVGIIGRNGAGKSTLLKILSQITPPTEGAITMRGRVASLLEVGTGFHPELTGRENIFLNGAILGMTRAEIRRKFDEIVAFAEIEKFLDTPVKRYSSGMYVRLAFAVAAHLEPEILLVDEVLAVGDFAFQKKCLGKMGDISKGGRTVLFVSHNMTAVQSLCSRCLLLADGKLAADGTQTDVVNEYMHVFLPASTERVWTRLEEAAGNDKVRIRKLSIRPAGNSQSEQITIRTACEIECEYWNLKSDSRLNLTLHLVNEQGMGVFSTAPVAETTWHGKAFPRGLFRSTCRIPGDLLNNGRHAVHLQVVEDQARTLFMLDDALVFEVADSDELRGAWHGKWPGAVRPLLEWTTERVTDPSIDGSLG